MATQSIHSAPVGGDLVYRQRRPVRFWHWLNALSVVVLLMSGMMIFNAPPHLYWGQYGANHEVPWRESAPKAGPR